MEKKKEKQNAHFHTRETFRFDTAATNQPHVAFSRSSFIVVVVGGVDGSLVRKIRIWLL
jgi:hypothetical protein